MSEQMVPSSLRGFLDSFGKPIDAVEKMAGDASTRVYYRLRYSDGGTAIVMALRHPGAHEEQSFLEVAGFLTRLDLPVPAVFAHHPDEGLVVLEDLGDELLEVAVGAAGPGLLTRLYTEAVELLLTMRRKTEGMTSGCPAFDLAFDVEKLMWELHFFMDHFVTGLCGQAPSPTSRGLLEDLFTEISRTLAAEPRIFTHRDYHSRNLICHQGRLFMIDFQDARMGPAQYDLASLLRDSYVTLPEGLVEELLARYQEEAEETTPDQDGRFRRIFDFMSLQRNIKALGTFGYQISVRGAERYRCAVPGTGRYIKATMARRQELRKYAAVVEDFIWGPATTSRGSIPGGLA